jgi:hypothetical protein
MTSPGPRMLKAARGTFRFKSDLRNHQAIVQPRLYDPQLERKSHGRL